MPLQRFWRPRRSRGAAGSAAASCQSKFLVSKPKPGVHRCLLQRFTGSTSTYPARPSGVVARETVLGLFASVRSQSWFTSSTSETEAAGPDNSSTRRLLGLAGRYSISSDVFRYRDDFRRIVWIGPWSCRVVDPGNRHLYSEVPEFLSD
jgi:hypothetical protein